MTRSRPRLPSAFRFLRDERGNSAIEFVMMLPIIMTLFMAAFESGYMMTRSTMLERAVDMTVRDLRLGNIPAPTVRALEENVCMYTTMFRDCENSITVELTEINQATFAMPNRNAACVRRNPEIQAGQEDEVTVDVGSENDLMVIRVCLVVDAIFPQAQLGMPIQLGAEGTYGLIASSAFVNEPN